MLTRRLQPPLQYHRKDNIGRLELYVYAWIIVFVYAWIIVFVYAWIIVL